MTTPIKPQFISFAGVDEFTDLREMALLGLQYPVEFGVLFDPEHQGQQTRFPSIEVVRRILMASHRPNLVAHLQGAHAAALVETGELADLEIDALMNGAVFPRVRVTTVNPQASPIRIGHWAEQRGMRAILRSINSTIFPGDDSVDWSFDDARGDGNLSVSWPRECKPGQEVGFTGYFDSKDILATVEDIGNPDEPTATNYWLGVGWAVRDNDNRFSLAECRLICEKVYGPAKAIELPEEPSPLASNHRRMQTGLPPSGV